MKAYQDASLAPVRRAKALLEEMTDILFDLPLLATDCADDIPLFLNLAHRSANN